MCDFSNTEWSDLPSETTVNDVMRRWDKAVNKRCTCGGKDFDDPDACEWCATWHWVIGRTDDS